MSRDRGEAQGRTKPADAPWMDLVHPNGRRRGPDFDPERAGLLLLDLQRYFLDPEMHAFVPGAPALLPRVRELVQRFRHRDRPVAITRHVDSDDPSSPMRAWWRDALLPTDERAALAPDVAELARDGEVLEKAQYDAFHGTGLEQRLRGNGVRHLVIAGVQTHLCVETTVRSAFCRGFHVWLPVDACAAVRDDFHRAALLTLSHGVARMTTVDEVSGWMG